MWLDHAHIGEGLALQPPAQWLELFREPFAGTGYYRPLTALSLSIDALWGHAAVFHGVNLALHALAAVLLLLAAEALGTSRRAATLGALLFAAHPVGSLVAGAVAFRSESLIACGLFGLIAAHKRGRPGWAAAAVLVASLSKETGWALAPLFVLALELERRSKTAHHVPHPIRPWTLFAAEGAAFAAALGLRLLYAPRWLGQFPELSAAEAVGTRLSALAKSAAYLFAPIERSICDAFPITQLTAPAAIAGALVALGLCVLSWRGGALGMLTALAVLPSLQLVPTLRWWSPHYLYVAAAFLSLLVARQVERRGARAAVFALSVTALLGVLSFRDGRRYLSDDTLWRPEVAREAACREGHFYLGEAARKRKQLADATQHYEAALASRGGMLAFVDLDATLTNYGLVLFGQGRYGEAQRAFESALPLVTDALTRRKLNHDIATAMLAGGDAASALARLEAEARRPDALSDSLLIYAKALQSLGRVDEAEAVRTRLETR